MKRVDRITGGLFLGLGCALAASAAAFPAGIGGLPGAGFFPRVIGAFMAVLAAALLLRPDLRGGSSVSWTSNGQQVAGMLGLLFAYLCLWGTGFFVLRTAAYVAVTLRFLGQEWKWAGSYAAALTAFVWLAFDMGLNVTLE